MKSKLISLRKKGESGGGTAKTVNCSFMANLIGSGKCVRRVCLQEMRRLWTDGPSCRWSHHHCALIRMGNFDTLNQSEQLLLFSSIHFAAAQLYSLTYKPPIDLLFIVSNVLDRFTHCPLVQL